MINVTSRDETEVDKEKKFSNFYRALVTGILEHDEVLFFFPHTYEFHYSDANLVTIKLTSLLKMCIIIVHTNKYL